MKVLQLPGQCPDLDLIKMLFLDLKESAQTLFKAMLKCNVVLLTGNTFHPLKFLQLLLSFELPDFNQSKMSFARA